MVTVDVKPVNQDTSVLERQIKFPVHQEVRVKRHQSPLISPGRNAHHVKLESINLMKEKQLALIVQPATFVRLHLLIQSLAYLEVHVKRH